ncbi:MAG TPA: flavin reductase, partial [Oscillospiraceae bacterium]|nr:flavin reductase [Oscillospiraceae bacterium]
TNETMAKSLSFWGTRKIFSYGKAVRATSWDGVSPEMKENIKSDMEKLSQKIIREHKKHKRNPEIKTRLMFHLFRKLNKMSGWNRADKEYWEAQGWLGSKRPWN